MADPAGWRAAMHVVLPALAIGVLAWAITAYLAWGMDHMEVGATMALMPRMVAWRPIDVALVFVMWAVMMVAMMLPAALPAMLAYEAVARAVRSATPRRDTALFTGGYLTIWTLFAAAATALQWALLEARLVSPGMFVEDRVLGAGVLIGAGVYQWTPWKSACLARCRSPLQFVQRHWRRGGRGGLRMGLAFGVACLGCCWALMLLLFVLGVMNLAWIAALTGLVLIEKRSRYGRSIAQWTGLALIAWGALIFVARG